MKRNERIFRHCLCFLLAICCIVPVCSGCRRQEERRNLGVDDGIESFLFNFDSRDEVAALVKDIKRGVFPQSLSWHYDRNIMAKKNHQVPLRFTDDAEIISDVYYALGDAIVVGIAGSQTSKTPIDLTSGSAGRIISWRQTAGSGICLVRHPQRQRAKPQRQRAKP